MVMLLRLLLYQDHVDGLFQIIVKTEHGQKVDVHEKDIGREDLTQSDVAQIVDGIKLALAIHDVITDVTPRTQRVRGQGVSGLKVK